jgi:hypothetical protein
MKTKRYLLNVANIGTIDSYDDLNEAIAEAHKYHDGNNGPRGWKEACYVFDTHRADVVFELEPHDVPCEGDAA